jgi:hypothetical protein
MTRHVFEDPEQYETLLGRIPMPTTVGTTFGGQGYNLSVFAVAIMAMSMSGAMWMISTLVLTPILRRGDSKLRAVNPSLMAIVPAAALIRAFQPRHRGARQDSVHIVTSLT